MSFTQRPQAMSNTPGPKKPAKHILHHFDEFLQSGVFRPSEIKTIRDEFYATVSSLLIADAEFDGSDD